MLLTTWPPMLVKLPLITTLSSAWRAMAETALSALGLKVVSRTPLASQRASLLRVWPPKVVKLPPSTIRPSDCTNSRFTSLLVPAVWKVASRLPAAVRRPIRLRVWPPRVVNCPPTRMRPLASRATVNTAAPAPGLNAASMLPLACSRAMRDRAAPAIFAKEPPTRMRSSPCTARADTVPSAFGLKVRSTLPSELSRPIRLRVCAPSAVKVPPTMIFPSLCKAIASTEPVPALAPTLNVVSRVPSAFKRAIRIRDCPPTVLKLPPTRILPSGCTSSESTLPSASGSKSRSSVTVR